MRNKHKFETLFIVSSPYKQSPGTLALIYGLQAVILLISSPRIWGGKRTFISPCQRIKRVFVIWGEPIKNKAVA